MRPELPFLAAGAVAIAGGVAAEHKWPSDSTKAILGTVGLTIIASATEGTVAAPLVHAIGLLILLAATMAAINKVQKSKTKKKAST